MREKTEEGKKPSERWYFKYLEKFFPRTACRKDGHPLLHRTVDTGMCLASEYDCTRCDFHADYFDLKDAGWVEGREYRVIREGAKRIQTNTFSADYVADLKAQGYDTSEYDPYTDR